MKTFTVKIVTPEETIIKRQVRHLKAKNSQGYFGILANHGPFITTLDPCDVSVDMTGDRSKTQKVSIGGGCLKFFKNECLILSDAIDKTEENDSL